MKTTYYFKPRAHWNIITKDVYDILSRFYDTPGFLRKVEENP